MKRPSDRGEGLPGYDPKQWESEDSWLDIEMYCKDCGMTWELCPCPREGDEPPEHEAMGEPVFDEHSPYL